MDRKEEMSDKRSAILKATLELISERGFHGTPMSMIADEAEVGAGTIYRCFENKEDLIDQLYLELKRDMAGAMYAGYSTDLPLRERFRTMWLNVFQYYVQHPKETAFLEQYANSPYLKPETEEALSEDLQPAVRLFKRGIHEGVMKDMPQVMLAIFTFGVAVLLAKKQATGELVLDDAAMNLAVDACWDALKR